MKKIKTLSLIVCAICCAIYVLAITTTYNIRYQNYKLEEQLTELTTANDELQIQLTTNLSRTELMDKYPNLDLHDNIYYIEEGQ